jgi:DNA-directed RNA polymerase subunit RPC12/RpoP
MSPLYLRCQMCGRQQADGILSRSSWGHVSLAEGKTASACPDCKSKHSDWEQRLQSEAPAAGESTYQSA